MTNCFLQYKLGDCVCLSNCEAAIANWKIKVVLLDSSEVMDNLQTKLWFLIKIDVLQYIFTQLLKKKY